MGFVGEAGMSLPVLDLDRWRPKNDPRTDSRSKIRLVFLGARINGTTNVTHHEQQRGFCTKVSNSSKSSSEGSEPSGIFP